MSKLLVTGDYGDSPRLIPESFRVATPAPPRVIEKSPGHMQEFVLAATGLFVTIPREGFGSREA